MDEASYLDLISGRRRGVGASAARGLLRGLSWGYRGIIAARNARYDWWKLPAWLGIPVISVGNLTVGGTGKTPMVVWLCRRLMARGLKTAVLSRGYKASQEGQADELLLVSRQCPKAVAIGHPDRIAAGQLAIEEYGAQAAVLDDGFQHRRIGRDLDIVLIDATSPFGHGYLLPRGLLREPSTSLVRADVVVLTRCDQVETAVLTDLQQTIRELNSAAPVLRCAHGAAGFISLEGQEMVLPDGSRVGCFAGIGRPEAFARTMADLGCPPTDTYWWPDHHMYTRGDADQLHAWARDADLDVLVTTEKDAVKLATLDVKWPVPVASLRVEIAWWEDGAATMDAIIDAMLRDYEDAHEPHAPGPNGET